MPTRNESATDVLTAELAQIEYRVRNAALAGERPEEISTGRADYHLSYGRDEDNEAYTLVEMPLTQAIGSLWLVEIDDKTYGNLCGVRIYLAELNALVEQ
jgi:hypothetical protein